MRDALIVNAGTLLATALTIGVAPVWAGGGVSHNSESGYVMATDGAKIHYIASTGYGPWLGSSAEQNANKNPHFASEHDRPNILFVPGWLMPGWIWEKQIEEFSKTYHVVAMDPRAQGKSDKTNEGLYPVQMARDIHSVIEQLHLAPVVIVGWSMAIVETLAYVDQFGTKDIAGLVLVDELAGGMEPGDAEMDLGILKGVLTDRKNTTEYFVRKIQFHKPQPEEYIQRVIGAAMETPTSDAVALLLGRYTADYRAVLPKIDKPTLVCAARSPFFERVEAMQKQIPGSRLEVFEGAGHALFVDNAEQFNTAMENFLSGLK